MLLEDAGIVSRRNPGYPRHSGYERVKNDHYVEPRWLVRVVLDVEHFEGAVHDPCCGVGTIPSICLERGIPATGSDIVDRGFGEVCNLFAITKPVDNFFSNVPFGIAEPCIRHLLPLARRKVVLILPLTFYFEARERDALFRDYPPTRMWGCPDRPSMPPGQMKGPRDRFGAIIQPKSKGGTAPYSILVWERGVCGKTFVDRLPPSRVHGQGALLLPDASGAQPPAPRNG